MNNAIMPRFTEALNLWLEAHPDSSQRKLAADAGLPSSTLSQVSNGASITQSALAKLLPTIAHSSTRTEALALLIAYLEDETPPDFAADLRIQSVDHTTGTVLKDRLAVLAETWLEKARTDADFANMWLLQDAYMQGDTATLLEHAPRTAPQYVAVEIPVTADEKALIEAAARVEAAQRQARAQAKANKRHKAHGTHGQT